MFQAPGRSLFSPSSHLSPLVALLALVVSPVELDYVFQGVSDQNHQASSGSVVQVSRAATCPQPSLGLSWSTRSFCFFWHSTGGLALTCQGPGSSSGQGLCGRHLCFLPALHLCPISNHSSPESPLPPCSSLLEPPLTPPGVGDTHSTPVQRVAKEWPCHLTRQRG